MKTIKFTFDCGKAGRAVWEVPRDHFDSQLSDRQLQRMAAEAFRVVPLFFRLLDTLGSADRTTMDRGMDEIEGNVTAIAKRTAVRMGLPPR